MTCFQILSITLAFLLSSLSAVAPGVSNDVKTLAVSLPSSLPAALDIASQLFSAVPASSVSAACFRRPIRWVPKKDDVKSHSAAALSIKTTEMERNKASGGCRYFTHSCKRRADKACRHGDEQNRAHLHYTRGQWGGLQSLKTMSLPILGHGPILKQQASVATNPLLDALVSFPTSRKRKRKFPHLRLRFPSG
jgi:hypothetical protein